MALGELQLLPETFWTLTNGELMAMIRGFVVRRDLNSANHRNLYALMHNINRGKGTSAKTPQELWKLDIDYTNVMDIDEKLKLFEKIANNG
jgi:hypothetical protein